MRAKFGYLMDGKFHSIYSSTLLGVDTYVINHYKNRKDLIKKRNIPKKSVIVIYCQDDNNKPLCNQGGYPLQSTVIYGNSKLKEIKDMIYVIIRNRKRFHDLTEKLNERFDHLEGCKFPGSMYTLALLLNKNPNIFDQYYYVIKQASLLYLKEELSQQKTIVEGQKKDMMIDIEIRKGRLMVHGENMKEYLTSCLDHNDYEEFWNLASLDDLIMTLKPKEKIKK